MRPSSDALARPMISRACQRVFTICKPLALALGLGVAAALPAPAQVGSNPAAGFFDAGALTAQEKRVLQGALALTGDYLGRLDGAWGKGSQKALEDWSRRETGRNLPRFTEIAPLLDGLRDEWQAGGWEVVHAAARDTSYLFPAALLEPDPEGDEESWISRDEGLALMIAEGDAASAEDLHQYLLDEALADPEPYHAGTADWMATSVGLQDGSRAMARTERTRRGFETLVVLATGEYAPQMQLLIASYQRGAQDGLTPPRGGLLAALAGSTAPPFVRSAPEPVQPQLETGDPAAPDPDTAAGSGTAFYVAPDLLVTAAHVVQGCREMRRIDGLPLTVRAEEDSLDLAVLEAPEASDDWLDMAAAEPPRLGEPVTALGFPYLGNLNQGLTVTGGNVSALRGIDGGEGEIMISAPVQPGNSGGPLLNAAGAVIGVVVARVDDLAILEETGTLPQNMNFAVPSPVLADWLDGIGIRLPAGRGGDGDLRGGIPDRIARSVVPVLCYEE